MAHITRFKKCGVYAYNGFYVGTVGSETQIIDASGNITTNKVTVKQVGRPAVALTSGTTIAVNAAAGSLFTLTPAHTGQLNVTGGIAGQVIFFDITTSGTNDYTLTFGTGFKSTGTLATGTVTAKEYTLMFVSNGTNFVEAARTTAM